MCFDDFGFSAYNWSNYSLLVYINTQFCLVSLISFCLFPGCCNFLALGSILKSVVLYENIPCTSGNFHSPSIQLPVS